MARMRRAAEVEAAVNAIAAGQHGVFSLEQAIGCGATPKFVRTQRTTARWTHPHDGVYGIPGAPVTWRQKLMVAVLAGDGVASHRAAAALHKLDGFHEDIIEVTVERWARHGSLPGKIHESETLARDGIVVIDGIPTTKIERTIADLATVLTSQKLESAIDDATRQRKTKISKLVTYTADLGRRRGAARLRRLLRRRDPKAAPTDSELEAWALRLIADDVMPKPDTQFEIYDGRQFVARADLVYKRHRIAIELDSSWHESPSRRRGDAQRQNKLVLLGWTVLRFSWWDLEERPDEVLAEIRAALGDAGATLEPSRRRRPRTRAAASRRSSRRPRGSRVA